MPRLKINTWLTKRRIPGLFIFLPLASACFYTAWSLNDHRSLGTVIPIALTTLVFCIAGTLLTIYVSGLPILVQELVFERTAELDKSEQRNKAIVDSLPDMVFIIDRGGRYIDFNSPADHDNVVNPDHFIFKKVPDILPASLATEAMTYIEKVLQTGQTFNHSYQLEVQGKIRSYESRYVPHKKDSVMVLVRDTTEIKKAELETRESEQSYRVLVEQATDSIFIANFQGDFLIVNPAGCRMSQYTREELLKMRFHELAVEEELKAMPPRLGEIASGKTVTSERKMRRKDGKIIDVEVTARIIAPNRFLAFVRDITERKKGQIELLKATESLRQLNNYIENIREEERLNTAKAIHDELGQQLAVLKMDISKLGKKINAGGNSFAPDINELQDTINKMMETVRDISSGLRPGLLDDIGLIATLDWYCQDFSKRTGIRTSFISDITDDKFPQKSGISVFRIFQESLANVARHSRANKADVSLLYRDKRFVVLIEDNGKGFDPSGVQQAKMPGIQLMKERAVTVNGTYNINSIPGRGTIVELIIASPEL